MSQTDTEFIHRFVPSNEESNLLLLLLHGTGGTETDLLSLGQTLAYQAALLSPRGKVLENGMARYFRRISPGVYDLEDVRRRAIELSNFVMLAQKNYNLSGKKIIAVGYSNGANIAVAILTLHPELISGAILFRSDAPALADSLPSLAGKSILISAGKFDQLIDPTQSEVLSQLLKSAGADVTLNWNEAGHGLIQDEIEAAKDWLKQHFND